MKKILSVTLLSLLALGAWAENLQTIVYKPTPKMTCQNCEKKIKGSLRFVKGTKRIDTSLQEQTITITYDADKAKPADYEAELAKIGRQVETVKAASSTKQKAKK